MLISIFFPIDFFFNILIFTLSDANKNIKIFTTRPDTIFGATFLAVSVDHPICKNFDQKKDFEEFKIPSNIYLTTLNARKK